MNDGFLMTMFVELFGEKPESLYGTVPPAPLTREDLS